MHQSATRIPAVLDASFWINIVRMGLVTHLNDYFDLTAPPKVAEELAVLLQQTHPPASVILFRNWQHRKLVRTVAPKQALDRFEPGENEAIAVAQERQWTLLIDNGAPRDWSRGVLRLRVVDSPAFAVFLYDQGRINYVQATEALAQAQAARRVVREALNFLAELARRKGGRTE